jgi:hypothetical protein
MKANLYIMHYPLMGILALSHRGAGHTPLQLHGVHIHFEKYCQTSRSTQQTRYIGQLHCRYDKEPLADVTDQQHSIMSITV